MAYRRQEVRKTEKICVGKTAIKVQYVVLFTKQNIMGIRGRHKRHRSK
jgi:hypothetical protein